MHGERLTASGDELIEGRPAPALLGLPVFLRDHLFSVDVVPHLNGRLEVLRCCVSRSVPVVEDVEEPRVCEVELLQVLLLYL